MSEKTLLRIRLDLELAEAKKRGAKGGECRHAGSLRPKILRNNGPSPGHLEACVRSPQPVEVTMALCLLSLLPGGIHPFAMPVCMPVTSLQRAPAGRSSTEE